jgi:flagellar basal body-associated protein FliL
MSEQNWLESRKKSSRRSVTLTVILIIVASALFIFIRNNRELFFSSHERLSHAADNPPAAMSGRAADKSVVQPKPDREDLPADRSGDTVSDKKSTHQDSGVFDSVTIPDFACRLRDNDALRVILSLKLIVPSAAVRHEVLLKREELKLLVQKTVAEEYMNELTADSLRERAKRTMNRIIDRPGIRDVEFRNFSIEKVQRP